MTDTPSKPPPYRYDPLTPLTVMAEPISVTLSGAPEPAGITVLLKDGATFTGDAVLGVTLPIGVSADQIARVTVSAPPRTAGTVSLSYEVQK